MSRPVVDKRTRWQKIKDFFFKTYDETEKFSEKDIDSSAFFAPISYLGILFFVPLLIKPNSAFAKYHANQGLVLLLTELAVNVVICLMVIVLNLVNFWIFPTFLFTAFLFTFCNLFFVIFIILGAYNATSGYAKEIPLIGRWRIIKAL